MASQKLAGVLWLIAGISSGGIAFFLVDPLDLAIFIGGADAGGAPRARDVGATVALMGHLVEPDRRCMGAGIRGGHLDQPVLADGGAPVGCLGAREDIVVGRWYRIPDAPQSVSLVSPSTETFSVDACTHGTRRIRVPIGVPAAHPMHAGPWPCPHNAGRGRHRIEWPWSTCAPSMNSARKRLSRRDFSTDSGQFRDGRRRRPARKWSVWLYRRVYGP
jgi:hypothetical protein